MSKKRKEVRVARPFYDAVDSWFERMIRYSRSHHRKDPALCALDRVVADRFNVPNHRRLNQAIQHIRMLKNPILMRKLLSQTVQIVNGAYDGRGKEFGRRYNAVSPLKGQCSVTSEFFSMLAQAMAYEDAPRDFFVAKTPEG